MSAHEGEGEATATLAMRKEARAIAKEAARYVRPLDAIDGLLEGGQTTVEEKGPMVILTTPVSGKRKRDDEESAPQPDSPDGSIESVHSYFVRRSSLGSEAWSADNGGGGAVDSAVDSDLTASPPCAGFDVDLSGFGTTDYSILEDIGEGSYATVHLYDFPDKKVCDLAAIKCSRKPEVEECLASADDPETPLCAYAGCQPGTVTYELLVYLRLWDAALEDVPRIPAIFDYGELADGRTYMAMQLLGASWEKMIEDGTSGRGAIVPYLRQLVDCLQRVHSRDLVHCDVKPKNILGKDVAVAGAASEAYLLDFGLAFHLRTGQRGACQEFIGTADYSSDDRLLSRRDPLPVDDIVSLGYTALHAWLGDLPWRCDSSAYEVDSADSGGDATPGLRAFQRERASLVKEGLPKWAPFFAEWFEYCGAVLRGEDSLCYERLVQIIGRNEASLTKD